MTYKAMTIYRQWVLSVLAILLSTPLIMLAQDLDVGAITPLTKPQGDQTAANQKLDYHTDLFTGRFNYGIPVEVPPGRGGSEPALTLQYNSSDGNGWCGVGWDLDLGYIQRETRHGSPIDATFGSYDDSYGFIYSVAGQSGRLVQANDGTYRSEIDTSGLRFVFNGTSWVVTDKSGRTYKFGDTSGAQVSDFYLGTFKWALTTIQDANGNKTSITYQQLAYPATADGQLYLSQISYNANSNSPTLATNCTLIFGLESANRLDMPGSAISGIDVYTSRRLQDIWVKCNGVQVRHYYLQYTNSASTGKSLLQSVTQYGTDDTVHWPAQTFDYSALSRSFLPAVAWNITNLSANFYPASLNTKLIDMNGDGLPDWVTTVSTNIGIYLYYNRYLVQLNNGSGFDPAQSWSPLANEAGDNTSTAWNLLDNYYVPLFPGGTVTTCTLEDMNGDGLPDRVMTPNSTGYFQVQLNTGAGFDGVNKWQTVPSGYDYSPRVTLPGSYSSTTVDTLLDMNGDGLPDLVMASSVCSNLSVYFNTGQGSGGYPAGGAFNSSPVTWHNLSGCIGMRFENSFGAYSDLVDLNGDGLPDHILTGGAQLNLGSQSGFGAMQSWGLGSTEPYASISYTGKYYYRQLLDINGDGLPDLVYTTGDGTYTVRFNTGRGFSTNSVTWTGVDTSVSPGLNSWYLGVSTVLFADMNGDGLPDRVMYSGAGSLLVQLNAGPHPDLLTTVNNGIGGTVTVAYTNSTAIDNFDGTPSSLPFPVNVVSSVTAFDGIRSGSQINYYYFGGFYDTTNREFRGFAIVDAADYLGTWTRTFFHQGGGQNWSSHGEYQDSRFKAGIPYDIITYGSDDQQYKETLNQVDQIRIDSKGVYFPYVKKTFEFDSEATGHYRCTLETNAYVVTQDNLAASTGNLRQEAFLGEVTNVSYSFSYTAVSDPSAPVYTTFAYTNLSNTNIVDKPSSVTVSSDAAGSTILRQTLYQYFGATGNLQEKSELMCPSTFANTVYTCDNYGNPVTETDPMGIVTTLNYDSASATFLSLKATGGLTNSFQYDPRSGALFGATDEKGLVTSNAFDGLLRLTNSAISTTANGSATLTRSDYLHSLGGISGSTSQNYVRIRVNDPASSSGYHETYNYLDGFGRPIQVRDQSETNNSYRVSDLFYNWRGQFMSQSYPFFSTGTSYGAYTGSFSNSYTAFDPIGRPSVFYPLAKATLSSGVLTGISTTLTGDAGSPVGSVSVDYNDGNNPWAMVATNALGKVHKYLLDSFGRTNQIVEVTSGGNFTSKLTYNQVSDLTKITDNASNQISFYLDNLGNEVATTDPDMGFWQYARDLDGRLKVQTDAKGQQTKFYYTDAAGRLTRREGWNAAGQCVSTNTWTYDSNGGDSAYTVYPGQLYMVTDDEGWQKFSYDVRGRTLKSVRYMAKNGQTYTNQFAFDDADRLNLTTYPNGGPVVTNAFDTGQHLLQVKQVGGTNFYTAKGFNALNQLGGISFGNGVTTTLGYYPASKRLQQITTAKTTNVQSLAYGYDSVGNISNVTDGVYTGSASGTIGKIKYDDLNRLLSLTNAGGSYSYGYNSIGNILTNKESGSSNYVYGAIRPHAVRNANGTWFTYDQNGNAVFRGGQRLDYDVNNHLYRVINTNGTVTTFGYAGSSERLWEQSGTNTLQVWIGGNYEEKGGQTLFHIYAGGRQVATFDKTGTNVYQYYHPDDLTSTSIQTDQSGNEIQNYTYSAFGQSRYTQNTNAFKVSRRYTGQVLDEGTGLYYYNARYYDPILARFIQPDDLVSEVFNPQSYNRYSYCVNNPLRYTDPSGHAPDLMGISYDLGSGSSQAHYADHQFGQEYGIGLHTPLEKPTLVLAHDYLNAAAEASYDPGVGKGETARLYVAGGSLVILGVTDLIPGGKAISRPVEKMAEKELAQTLATTEKVVAGKTFDQARREAFEKAGMTDPSKVTFTHVDPKTGTVVGFKDEGGAKVVYDGPHPETPGPFHEVQHVGYQTAGKTKDAGRVRENIPYEGSQHPSRSPGDEVEPH